VAVIHSGNVRVVWTLKEFLESLLEGRSLLSSPVPLLRLLRTSPRVFVRTETDAMHCHWSHDPPARLLVSCEGAGWLIGARCQPRRPINVVRANQMIDRTFGFGFARELVEGDGLVFGCGDELGFFARCERADLSRVLLDPREVWRRHRPMLQQHLPAFGHEFKAVLLQGEDAYSKYPRFSARNPEGSLMALRSLAHGLLTCVALRAHRGDFQ
jgi:hypothetical protein